MIYESFISSKLSRIPPTGFTGTLTLPDGLFPHQVDLVRWALRRGRAAIFADTGLGKTRMQLAWANALEASSLSERRAARKGSLIERVSACAKMVNNSNDPWIVWCDLNAEADALREAISGAVEIRGPDDADEKERRLADFAAGKIRVLITKPSIAGWGLNWQHCAHVAFVGVTDSFEAYYQAVRRCWRFGQKRGGIGAYLR